MELQTFDKLVTSRKRKYQSNRNLQLTVNSISLLVEAAIQQKGFILISRRLGDIFVDNGLLQSVLPDYSPSHNFAWLLHPPRQYMSTEAEVFLDFILERLDLFHYHDDDVINVMRVPFAPMRDDTDNN